MGGDLAEAYVVEDDEREVGPAKYWACGCQRSSSGAISSADLEAISYPGPSQSVEAAPSRQ